MSRFVYADAQYKALCPQYTNAPVRVAVSAATATSTALAVGFYLIRCDTNCFIKQGTSAVTATLTDFQIAAGSTYPMVVTTAADNGYLAGILASGTGSLDILLLP